jgi:aspartyl-tRNA(Asn)/glutamyl-tRNA(Gln) amidotransferase subunit B
LPIINPECIELALRFALACQMKINPTVLFDRKIYHYFDLPKGYQITQYRQPLASFGYLPLITSKGIKNIPLKNLQMEEDTAKTFYTEKGIELDFNRAGNPLIELTTEPIFHNSEQAIFFLQQLQYLLRYLDISEAKMEKGQLRVDLNFSLNLADHYQTPRYEVKNLNSFNNIEKALQYEISKHQQLLNQKLSPPISQTLGFDEAKRITVGQREKTDYFYLPESNIPPIKISKKEVQRIAKNIPVLP